MEPPLVLQLMMLEINPLLDAFVTSLPSFFQYLEKKTLNPRRLYFFQRLSQYLFEVRAEPCLHFAATSPDFIPNLIRHLSYAPIIQIFLGILTANTLQQSIDREKETSESANAPTRKQLIPKIVESLIISVESDLPGLVVGLYRLFGALTSNINLLQEILLTNDCSFIRSIFGQLNNPLSVDEAIGFLDDIFFKFVMQREKDADFFGAVRACLIEASSISPTLNANDIKVIIPRLRLIQSIVKHKVYFLLENETQFFSLISICYKFPWSNVLHCGIASVYVYILQSNEDLLSKAFLDANLVKEIVSGLGKGKRK